VRTDHQDAVHSFATRLELLNGKVHQAATDAEVTAVVRQIAGGRTIYLGNVNLPGSEDLNITADIATADVGVSMADYALAETGTLVTFASSEKRRASLLPPLHIAVLTTDRILSNLDELLALEILPAEKTASMVLITGPSRTADIEQILVRGVHGPGELHVVLTKVSICV
jgi:L-lactate dehydrogenase complex protein LldG